MATTAAETKRDPKQAGRIHPRGHEYGPQVEKAFGRTIARFSVRLVHLNRGWRYMVLDRTDRSGWFLCDASGVERDFGTEDEAHAACDAVLAGEAS